jgi:hypothetical protein
VGLVSLNSWSIIKYHTTAFEAEDEGGLLNLLPKIFRLLECPARLEGVDHSLVCESIQSILIHLVDLSEVHGRNHCCEVNYEK